MWEIISTGTGAVMCHTSNVVHARQYVFNGGFMANYLPQAIVMVKDPRDGSVATICL